MSLRYEWAWDVSVIGPLTIGGLDDDGGSHTVTITSGTYAHTALTGALDVEGNAVARYAGYTSFAAALASAMNSASSGSGTYTVTYSGATGYTISYSGGAFDINFGIGGGLMKAVLGFVDDRDSASSYSSDVRPHFLIIPAIEARSQMSDEYEPDGIVAEAEADDGTPFGVARESVAVWSDWTQAAETETAPSSPFAEGTPVFRRHATPAVPWTYQDAWRHARDGDHPFLAVDSGTGESAVHQFRAEGASFRPVRFAGEDQPYWSVPFRTRLIGRLP